MKIKDFVDSDLRYDISAIAADSELSQELQALLIKIKLLSEPMEDPFGARAMAALTRFQEKNDCNEPEFLGPQTAEKLLDAPVTRGEAIMLEALQNTVLKLRPLDSTTLGDDEKTTLQAGTKLKLTYFEIERKHIKIVPDQPIKNSPVWYVFGEHASISGGDKPNLPEKPKDEKPPVTTPSKPKEMKLTVPYKSQRDNSSNPDGACNVTSVAMCLEFFKIPRKQSSGQFEDELYEYMLNRSLNRHSPHDLAKVVRNYGAKDAFDSHSTVDEVKSWLASGKPVITHGYFTTFGHIVVLVGFDDAGFWVHDPYGEWFSSGYDRNNPDRYDEKGKYKHYSYNLIHKTCAYDGEFWVHFISK
ncbi:C39 family peptidase [Leptolyngbya sp. ST-U4]|uniref:C39 family peptidase n=1 Tax=Leptolyngbya sp. ST-U4 TaxID=2933912 RepID=UPI00329A0656